MCKLVFSRAETEASQRDVKILDAAEKEEWIRYRINRNTKKQKAITTPHFVKEPRQSNRCRDYAVGLKVRIRIAVGSRNISARWDRPRSLAVNGHQTGVNRPGRDLDHLPPPISEIKNERSCNSTPLIYSHDVYMVKFPLQSCVA